MVRQDKESPHPWRKSLPQQPSREARPFRGTSWFASGECGDRRSAGVESVVQSGRGHPVLGGSIPARGAGRLPCVKFAGLPQPLCLTETEPQRENSTAGVC